MKIEKVTIKGFQSHIDSTFQLSPGLTVITGPSDAGKTAIVRALRWLAFNEPQGEAFLHTIRNADGSVKTAVDQAYVEVTFDNGITISKTRRKGKTTYTHSLYPQPWEKAELPPEIKETLGLMKQEYGDFTTCLNFAFQLDAPFLLSETASVGAKVLGKIAGTEIVDKSIGEVNKRTHKARQDVAQAEKTIGQLDVELLEYLTLDEKQAAYDAVKERYAAVGVKGKTLDELRFLLSEYWDASDALVECWDALHPLEVVTLLKPKLQTVEYNQQKLTAIKNYEADFWKAANDGSAARGVLRKLEDVGDLTARLSEIVIVDHEALVVLMTLVTQYRQLKLYQEGHLYKIGVYGKATELLEQLNKLANQEVLRKDLEGIQNQASVASTAVTEARGRIASLENIDAVRGKFDALAKVLGIQDTLKGINASYVSRDLSRDAAKRYMETCNQDVEAAKKELSEAWAEAGGICPLCGKELEGGAPA